MLTDRPGALAGELDAAIPVSASGRTRTRSALREIIRDIRSDPPDVVLSTHTHVNLALCAARSFLPPRTQLVIREPIHAPRTLAGRSTRRLRFAQRLLYRRADLILATSKPMHDDLRRLTGATVELLHNPVDVDGIRASATVGAGPEPATGPAGRRIVNVGRLAVQKCLPDLVRAFAAGSGPTDRLVLLGNGPLRDEVLDLARELGVLERVQLLGFLDPPWSEIAAADALVLASSEEGMPNVVLEALAVGTPVIATEDLEVLRELASAAPPGAVRLVPRERLADAIREVAAGSPTIRDCLLPDAHVAGTAAGRLIALLDGLLATAGR
jgi:glycosyltransferase involved in cell wall biosynthesis